MSDDENMSGRDGSENEESEDEEMDPTNMIHVGSIPTIGDAYKIGSLKPRLASDDESEEAHHQPNLLLLDRISLL
jgi:hypothetical protein